MQEAQRLARLPCAACSTGRRSPRRSLRSARARRIAAAGVARSCRSLRTARCGTGARSTRSCADSPRSRSPIRRSRCLVARGALPARPHACAAFRRRRSRGERGGGRSCAPRRSRSSTRCCGGTCASARRCDAAVRDDPVARWSHPRLVDRARPARPPDAVGSRFSRPATRDRRSRCASIGASTTREALLARCEAAGIGAAPAGDAGILVDPPTRGGRSSRLRRRRVLGAGSGRATRGAAAATRPRACACSTPARRPAARRRTSLELADVELVALDNDARAARPRPREPRAPCASPRRACACSQAMPARRPQWWDGRPFDRILADVPCTASGVVRRHPDAKWLRRAIRHRGVRRGSRRACWTRCGRCLAPRRDAALCDLLGVRRRKRGGRSPRSSRVNPMRCANPSRFLPTWPAEVANSCLRPPARATIRTDFSTRCSAKPDGPARRAAPVRAPAPTAVPRVRSAPPRRHARASPPTPALLRTVARAARWCSPAVVSRSRFAAATSRAGRHDRRSGRRSFGRRRRRPTAQRRVRPRAQADARGGAREGRRRSTSTLEFELFRPRWYWIDEKVAQSFDHQYRVSYNALTRQYRVASGLLGADFESLEEVERFLSPRHVAPDRARRRAAEGVALRGGGALAARREPAAETVPGECARLARMVAAVGVASMDVHAMSADRAVRERAPLQGGAPPEARDDPRRILAARACAGCCWSSHASRRSRCSCSRRRRRTPSFSPRRYDLLLVVNGAMVVLLMLLVG